MDISKRNSALDITRIFAMFSVISIHFFLNNGFYHEVVNGKRMFVMTTMRTAFTVCVPLFILLTGCLMCKKTLSKSYYRGIVKTLGIYVIASIACIIYKRFVLGFEFSIGTAMWSVLNYSGANYAWYIEMYIGLFLLAPFLNVMYGGLPSQKAKLVLLGTLILLTTLPSAVNIFNFYTEEWWQRPYLSTEYQQFLPDWWTVLYPVTYYCIGAYLREFPVKMKKWLNLLLLLAAVLFFGWFNFYRSRFGPFAWGKYCDWYGFPTLILTTLTFILLSTIRTDRWHVGVKKVLMHLSDWCLGAYLLSFIFDNLIYAELNRHVPAMTARLNWYLPVVLSVTVLSLAASCAANLLWLGLSKLAECIFIHIKRQMRMSRPVPVLETERLILRPWERSDASDLFTYASDPEVGSNAGWAPHKTIEDSLLAIERFRSTKYGLIWAIEHKETGKVIGSVGLHRRRYIGITGDRMLGYSLSRAYWGQGLMTEAARTVVAFAFETLELPILAVSHFDGNDRSRRVIEKLNFTFVRHFENCWQNWDGEMKSENVYTLRCEDTKASLLNKVPANGNNLSRMT